jgi:hypothetical protein
MWKPDNEKDFGTIEWLLALKLGLEKQRDLDELVSRVRDWDRGGRVGDAFPAKSKVGK